MKHCRERAYQALTGSRAEEQLLASAAPLVGLLSTRNAAILHLDLGKVEGERLGSRGMVGSCC